MKKQILFLAFFVLAALAGTKSFGQPLNTETNVLTAVPGFCPTAVPLSCGAGTALAPAPGVRYAYTIAASSMKTIHWFVTDQANVVTGQETLTSTIDPGDGTGDYLLSSYSSYNSATNDSTTIHLTWKSFDGEAKNVLLVAYVVDAGGCTDNIEVYRIKPKYSFTLDLAGILDDGTTGASECVAPVQAATYDGSKLTVTYGDNYVFFAVNAANWMTAWKPAFTAVSDDAKSVVGTLEWAYPDEANDATAANWHATGTPVDAAHYSTIVNNGFIGKDGACIIVRVPVTHGSVTENIAAETITLTINGELVDPADGTTYSGKYPDLDEPVSGTDCDSNHDDTATYTITPRPAITATNPNPFETKVPTGN